MYEFKPIYMCFYCCFCEFDWQTFWTAIGAIGATTTIGYTGLQLQLQVWNNLQKIFTQKYFTEARGAVFKLLDKNITSLSKLSELPKEEREDLEKHIMEVCRRMDEFCHLNSCFWTQRILKYWWNPVGKSWGLLQEVVKWEQDERDWPKKWEAFKKIGKKCLLAFPAKLPPEKKIEDFDFTKKAIEIKEFIKAQEKERKEKEN